MDMKTISEGVVAVSGVAAIIGGIVKAISFFRPPKILMTAPNYIGIVVSISGTTPSIHIPLIISNRIKKESIVTNMSLQICSVEGNGNGPYNFEWRLVWTQDNLGNRIPEKGAVPIPVPGLTSIEKNIQFDSNDAIIWKQQIYEVKIHVDINGKRKTKETLRFFVRPVEDRCKAWYSGPYAAGAWVDNIPTYLNRKDIQALV
jgi:hypothetical protein